MLTRLAKRPDWLFLIFAAPIGLALCFLVPPLGGGNEILNFQRVAVIASGQLSPGPAAVPGGIPDFLGAGFAYFHQAARFPIGFSSDAIHRMAEIDFKAEQPAVLPANPIAVHHPFSYLPQVAVFWVAAQFGASPLILFLLSRLAGLLAALGLTTLAIRRMPSHRFALAALALLPAITFGRSTVDADPVTNGMAFLFIACVLREIADQGPIRIRNLLLLAVLGFVFAQCKSAYCVMLLLVLAIPGSRFTSLRSRAGWLALLILPGILASFGWMLLVKESVLAGASYQTWSGAANPDQQLALILGDPAGYLLTLFDTLFLTPFFRDSLMGLVGMFGPPVVMNPLTCMILLLLLLGTTVTDPLERPVYPRSLDGWVAVICAAFLVLSLTLLYLQWTGLGARVIDGFLGRYLYPLMPLLLVSIRVRWRATAFKPALSLTSVAGLGLTAMLWLTVRAYYA
ncbi:DUF2142 domain-containing protein [Dongia sp. agr-C8]